MKKSLILSGLVLLLFLSGMNGICLATETHEIDVEVIVDQSDHSSDQYNYSNKNQKYRQHLGAPYIGLNTPSINHNGGVPTDKYSLVESKKITEIRVVYTRRFLENMLKGVVFKNNHQNGMGFVMPITDRNPNQMILIIISIPEPTKLFNIGFTSAYSENWANDSLQLMAFIALEAMDWYGESLYIYGEGARRLMLADHWNAGFGITSGFMSGSENTAVNMVAGINKGKVTTDYAEPAWIRGSVSRRISKLSLYNYWDKNISMLCKLYESRTWENERTSWDFLIKQGFSSIQIVNTLLLEDYTYAQFKINENCAMPPDLKKFMDDKIKKQQAALKSKPQNEQSKTDSQNIRQKVTISAKTVQILPKNVEFDFDSATIRPDQIANVQTIIKFILKNPGLLQKDFKFFMYSTCSVEGSKEYNYNLGMARSHAVANLVKTELIKRGMSQADANMAILAASSGKDTLLIGVPEKDRKVFPVIAKFASKIQ